MAGPTLQARWQDAAAEVEERAFLVFESEDGTVTRYSYGEMDHVVSESPAGSPHSIPDIRRFTDDRLSTSKRPRVYTVVDELPRTSVGKIRKFLLTPAGGQPAGDTGHNNHTRSTEP